METKELFDLLNSYTKRTDCEYCRNDVYHWFECFKEGMTASGAFKMCLILENLDYVVKIPFSYTSNERKNACETEIKTYESAKKAGVEKIFLETWFIGFLDNGCPIYGQPKINFTINDTPKEKIRKYQRVSRTVTDSISEKVRKGIYSRSIDITWRNLAIVLYGKKFMLAFEKWTNKVRLGDLHNDNIGYLNDRPVILDYNYCR